MLLQHRTALRRRTARPSQLLFVLHGSNPYQSRSGLSRQGFHTTGPLLRQHSNDQDDHKKATDNLTKDPRIRSSSKDNLGYLIKNDYASLRSSYAKPKHPIILAHGLLGFDELHLAGRHFPGIRYWYGITEALAAKGVEVFTAEVPPSGRVEVRAERLAEVIERKAGGRAVNIVA